MGSVCSLLLLSTLSCSLKTFSCEVWYLRCRVVGSHSIAMYELLQPNSWSLHFITQPWQNLNSKSCLSVDAHVVIYGNSRTTATTHAMWYTDEYKHQWRNSCRFNYLYQGHQAHVRPSFWTARSSNGKSPKSLEIFIKQKTIGEHMVFIKKETNKMCGQEAFEMYQPPSDDSNLRRFERKALKNPGLNVYFYTFLPQLCNLLISLGGW